MSSILEDLQKFRKKPDAIDGAMSRFLNGPPDSGIAINPEDYPENDPTNTDPAIAVGPEDYPENDPSLEGIDPIELAVAPEIDEPQEQSPQVSLIQQMQQEGTEEPQSQEDYGTPDAGPLPNMPYPDKQQQPMQYGPNTELQDSLSTASGPAPSHLGGGHEGASTKDILEGKSPLTMDSLGLPDYDMPELETGRDGTVGTGWRNADLSPLPGEETIHEDIRKWADTNRTAGGSGMQGLREAYMEEVGAGQTTQEPYQVTGKDGVTRTMHRTKPGRDQIGFEEWLESKGFDPNNEQGYRGNRESLNRIAPMSELPQPGAEGSNSVEGHRANLRKQKVIGSFLQRYGDESVLSTPMERGEAEAIYDTAYSDALEAGENPVLAAGRALHGFSQGFQQTKDSQLRQNVSNRNSQNHRAQRFGVPVGLIAAVDQYRNAGSDPGRQQQALLMGAMQYPQIFLPIYQSQAYASNQAAMAAGMNGSPGGPGGTDAPPQAPGTFPRGERPTEVAPSYATNEHVQTARLQGLNQGGATHLISVTDALPPEQGRQIFTDAFPEELQAIKNDVLNGKQALPAAASAIRKYLGRTPTIEDMTQMFGPMSPEDYQKLRTYFSGTAERGWAEWTNETFGDGGWMNMAEQDP